jgi:hypothetical protein
VCKCGFVLGTWGLGGGVGRSPIQTDAACCPDSCCPTTRELLVGSRTPVGGHAPINRGRLRGCLVWLRGRWGRASPQPSPIGCLTAHGYETRPRMRRGASFHTRRGWAFALDKIASTMIEASPIESVGPFHRTKEKRPSALTTLRVAVVPVLGGARVPRLSLADQPGSSLALTGAGDLGGSSWLVAGMKRPV